MNKLIYSHISHIYSEVEQAAWHLQSIFSLGIYTIHVLSPLNFTEKVQMGAYIDPQPTHGQSAGGQVDQGLGG